MHRFHVYQDFFHNGRPCGTSEVTSIKEAIRLHTARGWNHVYSYRAHVNGRSVLFAEFNINQLTSAECSTLRFRFSPTVPQAAA
jgi:hypothetical protein